MKNKQTKIPEKQQQQQQNNNNKTHPMLHSWSMEVLNSTKQWFERSTLNIS